jgi:hypothetical protein
VDETFSLRPNKKARWLAGALLMIVIIGSKPFSFFRWAEDTHNRDDCAVA